MALKDRTVIAVRSVSVLDVLDSEGIQYKKIGSEAVTLCPWHNDSNPSLTINDEKNLCFCFVCNQGSDSISFIQQKFGLSFPEAIERIASKFNINIEYDNIDPQQLKIDIERRKNAINVLLNEHELYRENLKSNRAIRIREFLANRGIKSATSKYFQLGYSANGFFAGRITIPILDHRGTLIGFSGRSIDQDIKPKYKNSENSELFKKGSIVFNEHNALQYIREADSIVFVEGHFDVISLWQYGIKNVVAIQGTAAPDETVIKRLARRSKRFILCYDGDQGGIKATEQFISIAGPMACRGELTISVVSLPDGMDPDDCIRNESIDLYSRIENSPSWLDWQLDKWLLHIDHNDSFKFSAIEKATRSLVNSIQSPALRQFYIDKASKALTSNISSASSLAKQWSSEISIKQQRNTWHLPEPSQTRDIVEKRLLRLYIHVPTLRPYCTSMMDKLQSPAYRWLWCRIKELEEYGEGIVNSHAIMALLLVAEPHYLRQLRPIAVPTIKIKNNKAIIRHIEDVLNQELLIDV
jgi:DNA primase